jgi:8-oxo-dGTP diphosphatase
VLLCQRVKEPYKGLYNLVGGKIEPGEDGLDSAYRELYEETGIPRAAITLHHLMDFTYRIPNYYIEVYAGKLRHEVTLVAEANQLFWSDLKRNFFDISVYAGEGNIGHMLEQVKRCKDIVLKDEALKV